jgi:hypothetical protein
MTTEHEASRTLVKSPPELWAECSDASSLARHLGEFGEIRITRLEPETAVAWEGENASGTVRIEPSGWGTRVTLTANTRTVPVEAAAEAVEEEPEAAIVEEEPPEVEVEERVEAEEQVDVDEQAEVEEQFEVEEEKPEPTRFRDRIRSMFRRAPAPESVVAPQAQVEPEAVDVVAVEPEVPEAQAPEPEAVEPEPPEPERTEQDPPEPGPDPGAVLTAALDSLGQAHHRPFSRG